MSKNRHTTDPDNDLPPNTKRFENFNLAELTNTFILKHSPENVATSARGYFDLDFEKVKIDAAVFKHALPTMPFPPVEVLQNDQSVTVNCSCGEMGRSLCVHAVQVLYNLVSRKDLRAFFDAELRSRLLHEKAKEYGLTGEESPEDHFELHYSYRATEVVPKQTELISWDEPTREALKKQLLPDPTTAPGETENELIVVFSKKRHHDHFTAELYQTGGSVEGRLRNPFTAKDPLNQIWKSESPAEMRFYSALGRLKNHHRIVSEPEEAEALSALIENPVKLSFYLHNTKVSDQANAFSVSRTEVGLLDLNIHLTVHVRGNFHEVSGALFINKNPIPLDQIKIQFDRFIVLDKLLLLINNPAFQKVLRYFHQNRNKIVVHNTRFELFQDEILGPLENFLTIHYSYLKKGTRQQLKESGFDEPVEKLIYLTASDDFIHFTPVLRYGYVEIPVLSKKQIYGLDVHKSPFRVDRDEDAELDLITEISTRHIFFQHQLNEPGSAQQLRDYFFLHKSRFLAEDWFLESFETWRSQNIKILGFNTLKGIRINPYKGKVQVQVNSGINWFEASVHLYFGKEPASLRHLHKAAKNRSRYVDLDDGSQGLIPAEWLDRFQRYFESGEVRGNKLRIPHTNFMELSEVFEEEYLSDSVRAQLEDYQTKFSSFETINRVPVPESLRTQLRPYQQEGLNWLNFLDDFQFGGCLADDMGLGKTVQIIAFILHLRSKRTFNTNLVLAPTSLLFNWEREIEKFAPELRVLTLRNGRRIETLEEPGNYDVVLTSYGALAGNLDKLSAYTFNYIFLDESQAIKNPDSQRYKLVKTLRAFNRIVLTGTPIENNTFDLFGQLSFACPGLLGSKQQFKERYAVPIDRFGDRKRAELLQSRIHPFLLRRTKKQVASELPDKTEMTIYCELGEEQRKIYNAYEAEFRNYLNTRKEGDIARDQLHVLQGLTKLRQICNSPVLLNDERYYGNSSAKIDVLIEQIEEKSPYHKILVFSQFVGMLELIRTRLVEKGIRFEYLTGQTRDRETPVTNFQTDPEVRVFLISLKAGGTGLNLTEAQYIYLVDPWWNPAVENQAIDRSHRIGQLRNVVAVRLICPDTIEERILDLQSVKNRLSDDLIKTDQSIVKSLNREQLLGLAGGKVIVSYG